MSGSLKRRLGLGLAVSLVLVFAVQWLVVAWSVQQVAESYVRSRLEHDGERLLTALRFDAAGRPSLAPARVDAIYEQPFSGHYFRITVGESTLRSRSLWDQDLSAFPPAGRSATVGGPRDQILLAVSRGFRKQDRDVVVAVAEDLTPVLADIRRFNVRYGMVSLFALIVLLVLQSVIVYRGLRPIEAIRRDVRRLERGEIGELREDAPAEIQPMVREINRLLAVMTQRLARSRQALGNLAHALKTPLTLLADLASHEGVRAQPPVRDRLVDQTQSIQRLIDRELKRARLAGGAAPGQRFDLARELPALIQTVTALHRDKRIDIDSDVPAPLPLAADREDMLELLGNLLDNACKWARHRVKVRVEAGTTIEVCIEDDGPGVPEEDRERLAARGLRLDERAPGHGLGLAIAQDIAASYGGNLHFASAELGGLRVCVRLPAALRA